MPLEVAMRVVVRTPAEALASKLKGRLPLLGVGRKLKFNLDVFNPKGPKSKVCDYQIYVCIYIYVHIIHSPSPNYK